MFDPKKISWREGNHRVTLEEKMAYTHKREPEPEPKVKLADVTRRNDARLEELIEDYLKNRDKGLDKTKEVK